jgi:DNA-directed RNA polymerase specialized sigma24 family protein
MVSVATSLDRCRPTRRQLAAWAEREPDLAGVGFDELRAGQLDPAVPLAVKDRRLRALIRLARTDRDALTALLACLLPLLRTLAGRYRRSLGDDAWPAAVESLCTAVRSHPLDRQPAWVARNLARAANARLRPARAREDAWAARTTDLDAPIGEPAAEDDVDVRLLLRQAVAAGVVTPAVAELIELTRVHGVPLVAVAQRTGVTYEALKKRRQRGEAAVAAWLTGEDRRTVA